MNGTVEMVHLLQDYVAIQRVLEYIKQKTDVNYSSLSKRPSRITCVYRLLKNNV